MINMVARKDARYQIWEVYCSKEGQKNFLKTLDTKGAITINKETEGRMEMLVEGLRAMHVDKLFRERGINYNVIVNDSNFSGTDHRFRPRSGNRIRSPLRRGRDWKEFYPLKSVYQFLGELETAFPSTCTVSVIGRTVEGRDIKLFADAAPGTRLWTDNVLKYLSVPGVCNLSVPMLKISNSDAENTGIWIDGAIHAREWITTSVVTYIADHIARHFDSMNPYFTNKDWYFLPVANPDGYQYSYTEDRLWRKNRAAFGKAVTGVDINRNFGYNWGFGGNDGSSSDPYHINYRGAAPFSEPESIAIKDIILYSGTPFKIFLSLHSYSEVITFPWCHTAEPCPDYVTLLEGGTAIAKAIFETSGRMYKVGNFRDIMYYAAGTSIDWSYGTARIPYSYLLELRGKRYKFSVPKEEIPICCEEVLNGVKALVKFVDTTLCKNCVVNAKKLRQ